MSASIQQPPERAEPQPGSEEDAPKQRKGTGLWSDRARWFAAEFLVVVTGVVVALALQAWYQGRVDRGRERSYLYQIVQDLRETEQRIERADSVYRAGEEGIRAVLVMYHERTAAPAESLALWIWAARRYRAPAPVMATIEALTTTGDLRLIRNDSLRAAVLGYSGLMRYNTWVQETHLTRFVSGIDRMADHVPLAAVRALVGDTAEPDEDARSSLFPPLTAQQIRAPGTGLDPDVLLSNREAYGAFESMADIRSHLAVIRLRMLAPTKTLRYRIEATLGRSD